MGLEGIVAKRRDTPYRSGYVDTWRKIKCTVTESFAVVGFDPAGSRGVSSLKLARLQDGDLVPCGSVGSGIGATSSRDLRKVLGAGAHVVEHAGAPGLMWRTGGADRRAKHLPSSPFSTRSFLPLDAPPRRTHLQQAPAPGAPVAVLHNRG